MTEPKTHTLDVRGAVLHYDVRSNHSSAEPVLLLIGSPMDEAGFTTQASYFTDRTVVTYDPRGSGRSKRTDSAAESGNAMTGRAAVAVAGRLRTTAVVFPGGHDGFLGGEYGSTGKPEPFAAALREVLTG